MARRKRPTPNVTQLGNQNLTPQEEVSEANTVNYPSAEARKKARHGNRDGRISKDDSTSEELIQYVKDKKKRVVYKYPQDINSEIQPHSMVFRILERIPSDVAQTLRNTSVENALYTDSSQNRVESEQSAGVQTAQSGLLGVLGAAGGLGVAKAVGANGGSTALKFALGGLAGAAGYTALQSRAGLIRTGTIIELYVPQSPSVKYGAQWQDTELGSVMGALTQVGPGTTGLDSFLTAAGGAGEAIGRGLIGISDVFKSIGLNVNVGGTVEALTKKVTNPFKEQLFKTMNFRDFAFEWKFAPRNPNELKNVMDIIHTFKLHMHAGKDASDFFLIYPSEFQIEFRYRGQENQFVNKISTCALTDMKVDYGSGGSFTTFKDEGGAPSEITMQLAFKELELLTKDRIEQGY